MPFSCENPPSNFYMNVYRHQSRSLHHHNCIEICYVISGTATHHIKHPDGKEEVYPISTGNYIVLDYRTYHEYYDGTKDFTVINFLFRQGLFGQKSSEKDSFDSILGNPPFRFQKDSLAGKLTNRLYFDSDKRLFDLMKKSIEVYQNQDYGYEELLRCYATEIIFLLAHPLLVKAPKLVEKNNVINKICDYVSVHYMEPISLTEICKENHFSPPYISKKFKDVCGASFSHYLQEQRIRAACELLQNSELSVDAVANAVGYEDPASFRKAFFGFVGMNPLKFRKDGEN